jgi:outer membrane protein assembly factor BamB
MNAMGTFLMKLPAIVVIGFSTLVFSHAEDWPQFRGPRFDNVFPGQKFPAEFGPEKNVVWKTAIPSGQGSPCVVGERIFLTGFDGAKTLEILCLSRADGKIMWRKSIAPKAILKN